MRCFSYFLWWMGCTYAVAYYYKAFWDIFDAVWYQEMEALVYGFNPAGLPPFNWKIKALIWLSGIVLIGLVFGLIMDSVAKKHYKKKRHMPVWCIALSQLLAAFAYLMIGCMSDYWERLYYMPRFLYEIVEEALSLSISPYAANDYFFWFTVVHAIIFSVLAMFFYFEEKKKQERIIEKEEEFRREGEAEA